jgi:hypothetical protein
MMEDAKRKGELEPTHERLVRPLHVEISCDDRLSRVSEKSKLETACLTSVAIEHEHVGAVDGAGVHDARGRVGEGGVAEVKVGDDEFVVSTEELQTNQRKKSSRASINEADGKCLREEETKVKRRTVMLPE